MAAPRDVLIIGGGPAGLSAAMALGRMRRTALVCDDGQPRNAASNHANNLPGFDGVHPAAWRAQVRKDLSKYETIAFFEGTVRSIRREENLFAAELASGETFAFRKVILAHGIVDKLPDAPGFRELWGKSVFHCPYCHGFEVSGKRLGFVGNGKFAEHMLPMLRGLSEDLILFTQGKAELPPAFTELLARRKVGLVESPIEKLVHDGEELTAVVCKDGTRIERDGLFVAPVYPLQMKAPLGAELGCEKNEMGFFKVNEMRQTTVPGVFAAGDIMSGLHSVLAAAAAGQMAGAGVAAELLNEDIRAD